MSQIAERDQRYKNTNFEPRFKSLLTLLELIGAALHHEKIGARGPT
jgi:hypothetical protein